jgi:isopenicillin-N N-acyltransferase-like protein
MGQAFGETCRDAIQEFYAIRRDIAIDQAWTYGQQRVSEADVLRVAGACIAPIEAHHAEGLQEMAGIAEGAALSIEEIVALNGLTDIRDVLAWRGDLESLGGCSAFITQGDCTRDGALVCGQTWDLATNNMPYVLGVHRKPTEGLETWSLTTAGCLSLIGMNEHGLAVGTTNVRTTDARIGVPYLSIIHKALSLEEFDDAVRAVVEVDRTSGHYYYVADAQGSAAAIESTGARVWREDVESGVHVHCNHCLHPDNAAEEGIEPTSSTLTRTDRLRTILEDAQGDIDIDFTKRALSDEENGLDAICRDDTRGVSSNGAVVMVPRQRTIHACHGLPSKAEWIDLRTEEPVYSPVSDA